MWQLGGFARRSPTLDRRPDRSPGAAAQGPEMSPEMPVARLARCRNLDLRAQAEVLNALRSDTPSGVCVKAFLASVLSTDARKPKSGVHGGGKLRSTFGRIVRPHRMLV